MSQEAVHTHRPLLQGGIAVLVWGAATAGMLLRLEPVVSWYYPLAWWSYILLVDAVVLGIRGGSLLTRQPYAFLAMAAVSVPFWLVFELWNLALKNWYYIALPPSWVSRWAGYAASFATVLPAIWETADLLETLGLFRNLRVRPVRAGAGLHRLLWAAGILFLLLPILIPRYCFPLVWLGFVFLLEPFNHRWGRHGFLKEWELGRWGTLARVLTAGLICGALWEAMNFWAVAKWVYTVPFFEKWKIFEMPVPGYLGFAPFAAECYAAVQFLGILGDKVDRPDHHAEAARPRLPARGRYGAALAAVAGSVVTLHLMDLHTVNSLHPRVSDLKSLAPAEALILERAGVGRLDLWIQRGDGRLSPSNAPLLSKSARDRWRQWASLASLKGMGTGNLRLLLKAGVGSMRELAEQDPEALGARLRSFQRETGWARQPPRDIQIRVWIRAARKLEGGSSGGLASSRRLPGTAAANQRGEGIDGGDQEHH